MFVQGKDLVRNVERKSDCFGVIFSVLMCIMCGCIYNSLPQELIIIDYLIQSINHLALPRLIVGECPFYYCTYRIKIISVLAILNSHMIHHCEIAQYDIFV